MEERNSEPISPSRRHPRLGRSTNACQRCRRRKQRCDLRVPKCSACEAAKVSCLAYDGEKQSEVPRGYVSTLEARVKKLEQELEDSRRANTVAVVGRSTEPHDASPGTNANTTPGNASTIDTVASDPQEVVKSMGLVVLPSSSGSQPRFMGTSSGVTFAKLVLIAVKGGSASGYGAGPDENTHPSSFPDLDVPPAAAITSYLPPRHAAEHIINVYFQYRTLHVPILTRCKARETMDRVYNVARQGDNHNIDNNSDNVADVDFFICHMILAVGLCGIKGREGARPRQSEGCFNSALSVLNKVLTYSPGDMERLTIILLLAQYVALNPSKGNLWQLTGIALRLCIDLGLHWETEAVLSQPESLLDQRRRLFWATYRFDRLLVITLGRPFGIADQSINSSYPNPYVPCTCPDSVHDEVHDQRVSNHILALYRLKSEIKHVLYHQLQTSNSLAYPRPNYTLWLRDIQPRLSAWYDGIPDLSGSHLESIHACRSWWDVLHADAVMLLHRPNPLVTHPPPESLRKCTDASGRCVKAVKTLQREGKIMVPWLWVQRLFLAGLTLIYCVWQVQPRDTVIDVITTIQECASTLAVLAERFPEAGGCRDVFEGLARGTMQWLLGKREDHHPQDQATRHGGLTGGEIQGLRDQIPFSGTGWDPNNPDSIFPDRSFEFAEFLSAAAQWPGEGEPASEQRGSNLFDLHTSFNDITDFL